MADVITLDAVLALNKPVPYRTPVLVLTPQEIEGAVREGFCRPLPDDVESLPGVPREKTYWRKCGMYVVPTIDSRKVFAF